MANAMMFTSFIRLPQELQLRIIVEACHDINLPGRPHTKRHGARARLAPFAVISEDWRYIIEEKIFGKKFAVQPEDLDRFEHIVTSRRTRLVQGINLQISLANLDQQFWATQSQDSGCKTSSKIKHLANTSNNSRAAQTQNDGWKVVSTTHSPPNISKDFWAKQTEKERDDAIASIAH